MGGGHAASKDRAGRGMSIVIADRSVKRLSDWVSLVERDVRFHPQDRPNLFHSLQQADYVSVFGVTRSGMVPVVRQFRPALERQTLELPGGLRDGDEDPVRAAERELLEETGHVCAGGLIPLGPLDPDTGRLENRLWCYFAPDLMPADDWSAEAGVRAELMPLAEFKAAIVNGTMSHALHIAIVGLAVMRGLV